MGWRAGEGVAAAAGAGASATADTRVDTGAEAISSCELRGSGDEAGAASKDEEVTSESIDIAGAGDICSAAVDGASSVAETMGGGSADTGCGSGTSTGVSTEIAGASRSSSRVTAAGDGAGSAKGTRAAYASSAARCRRAGASSSSSSVTTVGGGASGGGTAPSSSAIPSRGVRTTLPGGQEAIVSCDLEGLASDGVVATSADTKVGEAVAQAAAGIGDGSSLWTLEAARSDDSGSAVDTGANASAAEMDSASSRAGSDIRLRTTERRAEESMPTARPGLGSGGVAARGRATSGLPRLLPLEVMPRTPREAMREARPAEDVAVGVDLAKLPSRDIGAEETTGAGDTRTRASELAAEDSAGGSARAAATAALAAAASFVFRAREGVIEPGAGASATATSMLRVDLVTAAAPPPRLRREPVVGAAANAVAAGDAVAAFATTIADGGFGCARDVNASAEREES